MAELESFLVTRGSAGGFNFTVMQSDGETPEDVSGWTFQAMARKRRGDPVAVCSLVSGGEIAFATDGTDGVVQIAFLPATTSSIPVDEDGYVFEVFSLTPTRQKLFSRVMQVEEAVVR